MALGKGRNKCIYTIVVVVKIFGHMTEGGWPLVRVATKRWTTVLHVGYYRGTFYHSPEDPVLHLFNEYLPLYIRMCKCVIIL